MSETAEYADLMADIERKTTALNEAKERALSARHDESRAESELTRAEKTLVDWLIQNRPNLMERIAREMGRRR